MLVFSQYIETRYAADLLGAASGGGAAGVGYLLKDRVGDVEEFVEALSRVAAAGTALDPEVVTQLLGASRRNDGLGTLTTREREVLALMAEGRSNAAIAAILVVSERSVEKHVGNIFNKLGLPPSTPTTAGYSPSSATWSPDRHSAHTFADVCSPVLAAAPGRAGCRGRRVTSGQPSGWWRSLSGPLAPGLYLPIPCSPSWCRRRAG